MSQRHPTALPIVCWSPGHLVAYDPATRQTHPAESAAALAGILGSGRVIVAAISRRNAFVRTARVPNASHDEVRHTAIQQRNAIAHDEGNVQSVYTASGKVVAQSLLILRQHGNAVAANGGQYPVHVRAIAQ